MNPKIKSLILFVALTTSGLARAERIVELTTISGEKVQVNLSEIQQKLPVTPGFKANMTYGSDGRATLGWPQVNLAGQWRYFLAADSEDRICRHFGYSHSIGIQKDTVSISSLFASSYVAINWNYDEESLVTFKPSAGDEIFKEITCE